MLVLIAVKTAWLFGEQSVGASTPAMSGSQRPSNLIAENLTRLWSLGLCLMAILSGIAMLPSPTSICQCNLFEPLYLWTCK